MFRLAGLALILGSVTAVEAGNWPAWRGPTGQGHCDETNLPVTWTATENVRWKVPLTLPGNSTPVVWDDRVFLTQATKGGIVRSLLCLARADGKLLWQVDVKYGEAEQNWSANWYANASPTTDGQRVVVCFASAGLYCYDLNGKELWKRTDLGKWEHQFGSGASPVLYGNTVIQWCGPNEKKGRNFLLAVDKNTGKTVWERDENEGSWCTPVVSRIDGQDQLLLGVGPTLKGLDPATGKEYWYCKGLTSYVYTSPLTNNRVAVGMSGYGGAALAVKLGATGDITPDRLWHHPKNIQRVGSGVIVGEHVYIVDENTVPRCYELTTGKEVWQVESREKGKTWGSLVHAEGRLYALMNNGDTIVFAAKPRYEVLAVNPLAKGEETNSSLAISNGDIFIRTNKHLWCIHKK